MRISDWSSDVCSSDLAQLRVAAAAVKSSQFDDAATRLKWVQEHAKDDGLQKVAELRSARVLWQQGKLDDALKLVDNNTGAFAPLFDELKGDIKLAKGDRDAARSAYQKAFEATPERSEEHTSELQSLMRIS